ncbi:MAG: hypothetical protein UX85_C0002G0059 [Candidatus Beckwithbacteria bacterium GW2011_GWB1_47_15]|uniref:DUF4012 domain-containing protein n=1 Tax=Candidatus Beckwithbacteria bacterium GW2011_GWB1_47_15 TaxID=1618371 RepID=A0A0G1RWJ9_9BACT|nr:MAG: hypothetical protein UY43_C0001G0647 [Candidatus Beckwithbacteria bacterium GW2011_GWC1_49_16]KKU35625.1 MAG: hypothetical protein UX50_C0002G0052 [Candidatus Beckwithbacteria bacterium GW2011_GWA1_46_30]KKU61679.1 MAG: hypothetical protein UX85_C0002G0059 [Candidatus Beckwithbacteria bacterium GW2011_GWB1_47_15]KKU72182.1 MAG: hypothetical protein UX97_C0001G0052 [Candidatus Beckwithbacteria bacterium GW2011_GWA2_47_25]KKW04807.1 MAG: hypothetical protein UY37_C0002G0060 [Candidatus Be
MVKIKSIILSSRAKKIYLAVFAFLAVLTVYSLFVAWQVKAPAQKTLDSLRASFTAIQNKDLTAAETSLSQARESLSATQAKYRLISWAKFIPVYGGYVSDGQHGLNATSFSLDAGQIVLAAIKPYADVLGFEAKDADLNIQSAEEKIIFILDTLDKIAPELDNVSAKVAQIEFEISQINPRRYPQSFRGRPVRGQLITIQDSLKSTKETLANIKPLLSLLPQLLGEPDPKTYLLVFQNDAELRASGGFLTAYAILETHKGKVTPVLSEDIYALDARFGNRLPAPEPILKYLPLVYNWHLRDMNLSPDFKVSMETFFPNYQAVASYRDVDGIIAIDTQIVVDILKVVGQVGVADWGDYHAEIVPECNCPQVVYKMEDYATRPTYYIKENRKGMIGPLMHAILLHVMNSPKKLWPQFVEIGLNNIKEKHLMFYFEDETMQSVAEVFAAAGRIEASDSDYFMLVDTNFAGAKSNLYVEQSIDQEISIVSGGQIEKTVTVTYTNPEPPDDCNLETGGLCLNGLLRDWIRIYVPEGSELVEVLGSDIEAATSLDLNKTVLEGFIELRPESKTKIIFKYRLPESVNPEGYSQLIQKQPGSKNHKYTVSFENQIQEFDLDGDRQVSF